MKLPNDCSVREISFLTFDRSDFYLGDEWRFGAEERVARVGGFDRSHFAILEQAEKIVKPPTGEDYVILSNQSTEKPQNP